MAVLVCTSAPQVTQCTVISTAEESSSSSESRSSIICDLPSAMSSSRARKSRFSFSRVALTVSCLARTCSSSRRFLFSASHGVIFHSRIRSGRVCIIRNEAKIMPHWSEQYLLSARASFLHLCPKHWRDPFSSNKEFNVFKSLSESEPLDLRLRFRLVLPDSVVDLAAMADFEELFLLAECFSLFALLIDRFL